MTCLKFRRHRPCPSRGAGECHARTFHTIPSRDVEFEIARQLKAELQAGKHPTTQALVPLGIRFVKILGAGSQGTAVLFEMDDENGATRKLVAKYEKGEDEDEDEVGLTQEKKCIRVSEKTEDVQYIGGRPSYYRIVNGLTHAA